jgi:hypothetical protein
VLAFCQHEMTKAKSPARPQRPRLSAHDVLRVAVAAHADPRSVKKWLLYEDAGMRSVVVARIEKAVEELFGAKAGTG